MFRFKQFSIEDSACAHKVGTDGTLLGAWVAVAQDRRLLDVGTGSGLIALMLAQRASATACIEAVELAAPEFEQARVNIAQSPWFEKIRLHHVDLQHFTSTLPFDHVVSNPPYFSNSFKPPQAQRVVPRHTDALSFIELIKHTKRLLADAGKLSVILPYTEGLEFILLAKSEGFFVSRQWNFLTRKGKPVERLLLEFSRHAVTEETGEILLYEEQDNWSEGYKSLTRDFYLKL